MKLQSEFSREFLKNNFRPFAAPIASAARTPSLRLWSGD